MQHALGAGDVFGQFDSGKSAASSDQCADRTRGGVDRAVVQLLRGRRVAQIVCALAIETDAVAAHVQPGAHAIGSFRRGRDARRRDLDAPEAHEGITHHFTLEGARWRS